MVSSYIRIAESSEHSSPQVVMACITGACLKRKVYSFAQQQRHLIDGQSRVISVLCSFFFGRHGILLPSSAWKDRLDVTVGWRLNDRIRSIHQNRHDTGFNDESGFKWPWKEPSCPCAKKAPLTGFVDSFLYTLLTSVTQTPPHSHAFHRDLKWQASQGDVVRDAFSFFQWWQHHTFLIRVEAPTSLQPDEHLIFFICSEASVALVDVVLMSSACAR